MSGIEMRKTSHTLLNVSISVSLLLSSSSSAFCNNTQTNQYHIISQITQQHITHYNNYYYYYSLTMYIKIPMDTPKVTTVLNNSSIKHNVPHLTMSAYVQCHGWGSSSKATYMQEIRT